MTDSPQKHHDKQPLNNERRNFLKAGFVVATASLIAPSLAMAQSDNTGSATIGGSPTSNALVSDKRKLGSLEVSSLGIGVQNMSRTYQTTIPNRTEMHNIIKTAFDRGVTFYDAAEAYVPHEVERILGEAVKPFRDKIVIATKFGWNIDQKTEKFLPGLNSRPEHIKLVVEGMLKRLQTDRTTFYINTA